MHEKSGCQRYWVGSEGDCCKLVFISVLDSVCERENIFTHILCREACHTMKYGSLPLLKSPVRTTHTFQKIREFCFKKASIKFHTWWDVTKQMGLTLLHVNGL